MISGCWAKIYNSWRKCNFCETLIKHGRYYVEWHMGDGMVRIIYCEECRHKIEGIIQERLNQQS